MLEFELQSWIHDLKNSHYQNKLLDNPVPMPEAVLNPAPMAEALVLLESCNTFLSSSLFGDPFPLEEQDLSILAENMQVELRVEVSTPKAETSSELPATWEQATLTCSSLLQLARLVTEETELL